MPSKYEPHAVVVFEGYLRDAQGGANTAEHMTRSWKHTAIDKFFDDTMIYTMSMEKFLANHKNKDLLISMMIYKLSILHANKQKKTETPWLYTLFCIWLNKMRL